MDHSKKPTYFYSIDALRVIAIIAVIGIHISIKILAVTNHNIEAGILPFTLNQVTRFAVPLFFLISGFVLELNYRNKISYSTFFKKRASRVLVPFLFWSLVYISLGYGFGFINNINFDFLYMLINGKAAYHLYFIPTLIIFYILFPLFHRLINILKTPFVLGSLIILQNYFLYQDFYVNTYRMNNIYRIALLSFAFFIIGMVASHYKNGILKIVGKYNFLFLSIFLFFLIFLPIHIYQITLAKVTTSFIYNQHDPITFFYTISIFLFFTYFFEKTELFFNFFQNLSKLSLFVFFIHVLIQTLVWENVINNLIDRFGTNFLVSFWFTPTIFLVLTVLSFTVAYLARRIPNLYKITG